MNTKPCLVCGKVFTKDFHYSQRYWQTQKYCSRACYAKAKLGKLQWQSRVDGNPNRHSTEQIPCQCGCGELISRYDNKGREKKFKQGHQNLRHKGIKRPEQSRRKRELIASGKWHPPVFHGSNHPMWRGGRAILQKGRNSPRYKVWQMRVFRRDWFTCRKCHYKGRDIVAHHKQFWSVAPKLRYITSNGLTLCRPCHVKLHKPAKHKSNI